MTTKERKATNRLLGGIEQSLRALSVALDGARYCAGNLRTATTRFNAAYPDAPGVPMSPYAEAQLTMMQDDVKLQSKELERAEEELFPGRRAKRQRECDERNQDRRTEQMERYAGYTGA